MIVAFAAGVARVATVRDIWMVLIPKQRLAVGVLAVWVAGPVVVCHSRHGGDSSKLVCFTIVN